MRRSFTATASSLFVRAGGSVPGRDRRHAGPEQRTILAGAITSVPPGAPATGAPAEAAATRPPLRRPSAALTPTLLAVGLLLRPVEAGRPDAGGPEQLLGLVELLHQLVDRRRRGPAALGDAQPAGAVDDRG